MNDDITQGQYISEAQRHIERKQKYKRNVESEYGRLFLKRFYPDTIVLRNQRIGSINVPKKYKGLSEKEQRMFSVYRKYVDLIAITNREIILLEAKRQFKRAAEAIGQLPIYTQVIIDTPELKEYLPSRRIVPTLVYPKDDPHIRDTCQKEGIHFVIWDTPEIEQIKQSKPKYQENRRSYRIIEDRYISDFLIDMFPKARIISGHTYKDVEVDGIAVDDKTIYLIESKIKPSMYLQALGRLKNYPTLFRSDPDIGGDIREKKVVLMLLTPLYDPLVKDECVRSNVKYMLYKPKYVDEYLTAVSHRERQAKKTHVDISRRY